MAVYISELKFENSDDFVEIVATDNEDLTGWTLAVYNEKGTLFSTHSVGGMDATSAGNEGYLVTRADGLVDVGQSWGVALIDANGNTVQFISHKNPITAQNGPAAGQTSDINFYDATAGGESMETSDGGASYAVQTSPNPGTIPCYAAGTLIDTPHGPCPVDGLRVGQRVWTADMGDQPILWLSRRPVRFAPSDGLKRPVLIPAASLGPGIPARDLVVSAQHRILVGEAGQALTAFPEPRLVPAIALVGLPGIRVMRGCRAIHWVHFALPRHAIVRADGCLTESLLLGPVVRRGLAPVDRSRLDAMFGSALCSRYRNGPPARPVMHPDAAIARIRQARRQC